MLSDEDKRQEYDVFGDVEGVHAEFERYFEEHFVDILLNMCDFSMPKKPAKQRRPNPNGRGKNVAREMQMMNQIFSSMLADPDFGDEDDLDAPPPKRKRPASDDEWEDVD